VNTNLFDIWGILQRFKRFKIIEWRKEILLFFDDSGDFAIHKGGEQKVSLWIGCLIPENRYSQLTNKFIKWEKSLHRAEKKKGEAKGALLTKESRDTFFSFLNDEHSLLVYPTILDLDTQKKYIPENLTREMYEDAMNNIDKLEATEFKQEEILQAKRIKNLSDEQFLKLLTLGTCIIELLRHSLTYRIHGEYVPFWEDITYYIDRSSAKNSREEKVFSRSIRWFLYHSTKKNPLLLPDDMFFTNHPFMKKFDTPHGIDMEKLFKKITFEVSFSQIGLRIADIIANTLFRVLHDLENKKGMMKYYKKIMKHSYLGPYSNLGFVIFPSREHELESTKLKKYAILQKIISDMDTEKNEEHV
jgi:hypothetical protein